MQIKNLINEMNSRDRFKLWQNSCNDKDLISELEKMKDDEDAIENSFYKDLEFGTAGIRAVIGVGTNRLNVYTVAKITKGIACYMQSLNKRKIVICRDCRNFSDKFSFVAARVFASCGIEVVITEDIMPTPMLSFLVRSLKADMGVMITASHNTAIYNGYKVYNSHGYQLTDDDALEISNFIKQVEPFGIVYDDFDYYFGKGIISYADQSLVEEYLKKVREQSRNSAEGINIVYSPLNGTGYKLVPRILKMCGVSGLEIVKEQAEPDGNFPTCKVPNPEKREALSYGIELAKSLDYDIVLATDPDADRIGVAVKHKGEYNLLSGNEIGVLLTDYLLADAEQKGKLQKTPIVIKSIVSTPLVAEIVKSFGGKCLDVLTGFKYIGETITKMEETGEDKNFVLGFEESHGYLVGTYVRDKDAVVAAMLIAEMAAKYKKEGKTLFSRLDEIYAKYGTYQQKVFSYEFGGATGSRQMKHHLESFRANIPLSLGGSKVINVVDYLFDDTGLPKTNALRLDSELGSRIIIRPSGTEPLIKFYITVSKSKQINNQQIENIENQMKTLFLQDADS